MDLLKDSVVIYYLTSSSLFMARLIYTSSVSFHIVQIQCNQTAMWVRGLISIQVNLAFQFFSFSKPTKSPASPQSLNTVLF